MQNYTVLIAKLGLCLLLLGAAAAFVMLPIASPVADAAGRCEMDSDCDGNETCTDKGRCMSQGGSGSGSGGGSSSSTPGWCTACNSCSSNAWGLICLGACLLFC